MSEKVKSIERASNILLLINDVNTPLGITEISERLNLHKSTVHRILTTFEEKGIVRKTEDDKYGIGLQIYAMGLKVASSFSTINIIKPYLKNLANEVGEAVNLSMIEDIFQGNYRTLVVDKAYVNDSLLAVNPNVGESTLAHVSSVGKCLLAFSHKVDVELIGTKQLEKYTDNTITDINRLKEEILEIKKRGYAIDNEEREIGLYCVGVPIFERKSECSFAMSISGPTVRMDNEELDFKISALLKTQRDINKILSKIV